MSTRTKHLEALGSLRDQLCNEVKELETKQYEARNKEITIWGKYQTKIERNDKRIDALNWAIRSLKTKPKSCT